MATDALAPAEMMFQGNLDNLFRGQFIQALIRDYDPTDPLDSFTPFDTASGEIADHFYDPTGKTFAGGWLDMGLNADEGYKFSPAWTLNSTMAAQTRRKADTDITEVDDPIALTALESNPIIDALQNNLPLASIPSLGAAGYSVTAPRFPFIPHRQLLLFAFRRTASGLMWCKCRVYPNILVTKPGEHEWSPKKGEEVALTFTPEEDQLAGFAVRTLQDGPGHRARGGTTGVPGTPTATAGATGTATLAWTAPSTPNSPYVYKVYKGGVLLTTGITFGGTASAPTATITGLTSGATTFTVQAMGANMSLSAQSAASNSVTIT